MATKAAEDIQQLAPELVEDLALALEKLPIDTYGDEQWVDQHVALERLSMQATLNVRMGAAETVSDALLSFDKVPTLIHQLLVTRTWKRNVYPLVRKAIARKASILAHAMIQHEATLLNLLQTVLYKKESIDKAGDTLVDLIDMLVTHLDYLNSDAVDTVKSAAPQKTQSPNDLLSAPEHETLAEQSTKLAYETAWAALAALCHMTHHLAQFPLAVLARLINTRDILYSLVYLLEGKPWERNLTGRAGVERFEDGRWVARTGEDVHLVAKPEAHAWMAVANLVLDPEVQRRYEMTEHRRATLIKLTAHFERNTTLLTQLPFLEPVYRYLLHVQMAEVPAGVAATLGVLVEAMPHFEPITRNWPALATRQLALWTPKANRNLADKLAHAYDWAWLEELAPEPPKCAACGQSAEHRCAKCRSEWYCGRACQVKAWKAHRPVCALLEASAGLEKGDASGRNVDKPQKVVEVVEPKQPPVRARGSMTTGGARIVELVD
ncbi:Zinc finger MYND domain-containing protein 10 [Allomyces arbusculus]|nr:Zinc finger MYND domain-containing protein 10 [Allomyces arbusculus]